MRAILTPIAVVISLLCSAQNYTFEYSEEHEQSLYVFYTITEKNITGKAQRKDNFKPDTRVKTGSAQLSDYKGSGYDRGHLCPAAAMKQNQEAMDETFLMTNISPQLPAFNRYAWKDLEYQVRGWVFDLDTLQIYTGPLFENNLDTIGKNGVIVPGYYYKVIYAPTIQQMIGFILPHCKISEPLESFYVSVDEVEKRTGLDFFAELPDSLEVVLEQSYQLHYFPLH